MANSVNLNKQPHGLVLQTEAIAPSADGTILAATKTLKNTDSGKILFCNCTTYDNVFQLPAPEAGLNFTWIVTAASSGDLAIFTSATSVDIFGIGAEEGAHDATMATGLSTLQLDDSAGGIGPGNRISLESDGSNWYITDMHTAVADTIVGNAGHVMA